MQKENKCTLLVGINRIPRSSYRAQHPLNGATIFDVGSPPCWCPGESTSASSGRPTSSTSWTEHLRGLRTAHHVSAPMSSSAQQPPERPILGRSSLLCDLITRVLMLIGSWYTEPPTASAFLSTTSHAIGGRATSPRPRTPRAQASTPHAHASTPRSLHPRVISGDNESPKCSICERFIV